MSDLIKLKEAKERFDRAGVSVAAFARELGVHPETVRQVLNGKKKGLRGDAHKVAVVLGLKDGVILKNGDSTVLAVGKAD